jgi:hypothetical protein
MTCPTCSMSFFISCAKNLKKTNKTTCCVTIRIIVAIINNHKYHILSHHTHTSLSSLPSLFTSNSMTSAERYSRRGHITQQKRIRHTAEEGTPHSRRGHATQQKRTRHTAEEDTPHSRRGHATQQKRTRHTAGHATQQDTHTPYSRAHHTTGHTTQQYATHQGSPRSRKTRHLARHATQLV